MSHFLHFDIWKGRMTSSLLLEEPELIRLYNIGTGRAEVGGVDPEALV